MHKVLVNCLIILKGTMQGNLTGHFDFDYYKALKLATKHNSSDSRVSFNLQHIRNG